VLFGYSTVWPELLKNKKIQKMESEVCDKQKSQGRSIVQLQIVWQNQMFRYCAITLEASDIILLMFSNSF
jgi:hypothetical protein